MKRLLYMLFFLPALTHAQSIVGGATGSAGYLPKGTGTAGLLTGGYGNNISPTANGGGNQTITQPASSVTLTGSGTAYNGATISTYAWTQPSGPVTATIVSASSATTSVTGLSSTGTYVFTLTVTDNHGLTGSNNDTITVNAASGGDSAAFNFSLSSNSVSGWVNVSGDPSTGIRTGTGGLSNTITITTVATANWPQYSGTAAFDNLGASGGTYFPAQVMLSADFTYSGSTNGADSVTLTNSKPQYIIGGLNSSKTYSLSFTGSLEAAVHFTSLNKYRAIGAATYVSALINPPTNGCYTNTANGVNLPTCQPDGSGNIKIYLFTEPGQEAAICSGIKIVQN